MERISEIGDEYELNEDVLQHESKEENSTIKTNSKGKIECDELKESDECISALNIHRTNLNAEQAMHDLVEAENIWADLPIISFEQKTNETMSMTNISLSDAIKHYAEKNLDEYQKSIRPVQHYGVMRTMLNKILGMRNLDSSLHSSRNFIFKVALCPFDNEDPNCFLTLKTVYKKIIGTQVDCPRYGNHWDLLGFQGTDPATDFRGCGMLGLLHILNLCQDENLTLCRKLYALSHHSNQNFPLCLMSINITSIVLQAIRDQVFNNELNRRHKGKMEEDKLYDFFKSVCEFHVAIFFHLYTVWKDEGKTMADSGFVLESIKKYTKKSFKQIIKNFKQNSLY